MTAQRQTGPWTHEFRPFSRFVGVPFPTGELGARLVLPEPPHDFTCAIWRVLAVIYGHPPICKLIGAKDVLRFFSLPKKL